MKSYAHWIEHAWDGFLAQPREEIALRMTAVLLLLHGASEPMLAIGVAGLCGTLLLAGSHVIRSRALWTTLAVVLLVALIGAWYTADNHKFLIFYWTCACALAVWSRDAGAVLEHNARLLIALAFTFATLWKFLGGEYLDGSFFTGTLLLDRRFVDFVTLATEIDAAALTENRELLRELRTMPGPGVEAALPTGVEAVRPWALAMSYATIAIEALVALAFWRAWRRGASDFADWTLIVFIVFTYTLTPVVGFGFLLVSMGFAQCPEDRPEAQQAFLWAFVVVQFTTMPSLGVVSYMLE